MLRATFILQELSRMLTSILMIICLNAHAVDCRRERIEFTGSAMACVTSAQPVVAEWADLNPDWRVASWKCRSS